MTHILHLYAPAEKQFEQVCKRKANSVDCFDCLDGIEVCFNVEVTGAALTKEEDACLRWLVQTPGVSVTDSSTLPNPSTAQSVIEVGPRLNVCTPFSTNATSICHAVGLTSITRIEVSRRLLINTTALPNQDGAMDSLLNALHDRMTETQYSKPLATFQVGDNHKDEWITVDVVGKGSSALRDISNTLGLAYDDADVEYYTSLFRDKIKRNPTSVECFDLSQSNSEHSRHWFFCGRLVIDGEEQPLSLMKIIKATQTKTSPNNSVIAFHDNSSAIEGFPVNALKPTVPDGPGAVSVAKTNLHITLTAETHNFPTGVAPFPGATTGTGGRIRDNQSTGRGANVIAGSAGYCVGNLQIPGYPLPWEDESFVYPSTMASPLSIEIDGSNGASDYGNKFGEPIIYGFTRSFGLRLPNGERREWVKPIMFTSGIGSLNAGHVTKMDAQKGFLVAKVGGPAYRIGMGGGAASSVDVQGDASRDAGLDFNAVQRGDAEMEQKMNRVIRACIELGDDNPICSIHDQGAGGNGNVLKEISEPAGASFYIDNFVIGDKTLSVMELWGAEYQENNAILIKPESRELLERVCARERVPIAFVGHITGDGRVRLMNNEKEETSTEQLPFDMSLDDVLSKMPAKVFKSDRTKKVLKPLDFPEDVTPRKALDRVLRLMSVGSKRFLTNKVDRSVTGLIAQQQCVGPLHTPLANVAITALSHFDNAGAATAIGEQPIKGLVDVEAGARMSVAEALTNLVFAKITKLADIKFSGNWMWAAKLPGEGAALHDACVAMCNIVTELGFALDGGKDSLSMAAKIPGEGVVKAPGELTITVYAPCPDVRAKVTPDLKGGLVGGKTALLFVDIGKGAQRLGGSSLAHVYGQLGDVVPDVDVPALKAAFEQTQALIGEGKLLAGHDRSDGGLLTTILEMSFAGNRGLDINITDASDSLALLYNEELGLVLEVDEDLADDVCKTYSAVGVPCTCIGYTTNSIGPEARVTVTVNGSKLIDDSMASLRDVWEDTSFAIEKLQAAQECVEQEKSGLASRTMPQFKVSFDVSEAVPRPFSTVVKVATIREEGSNGDREMISTLTMAGFEVHDVTMQDILTDKTTLDAYRGVIFVGGFSYADTFGSAKGWAAGVLFHEKAKNQFSQFYERDDTFSLGICNGCQLMGLLGWIGSDKSMSASQDRKRLKSEDKSENKVTLGHNTSGRFESRFATVKIQKSSSVLLAGMEGSTLGVWVAHGEGKFIPSSQTVLDDILEQDLAPLRYVDDSDEVTTMYPFNPNGSPHGIAGLCSANGRHLAMMPHPERAVLSYQWPWCPRGTAWQTEQRESPWMKLFCNARAWCEN
eukprot:m.133495 g.133495  ORF g.133495 m.133495 type:complete len:1332 (+) comp14673_c1_seq5:165-4160(+)